MTEEDRQLIIRGLAVQSLRSPGFEYACSEAATKLSGRGMFYQFREVLADIEPADPWPKTLPEKPMNLDLEQLDFVHEDLAQIINQVEDEVGITLTVTSLYRPGDQGVHGTLPVRGVDVRCRDLAIGQAIAAWINDRMVYDPDRPELLTCIVHDAGSGLHLHIQCHPNTRSRPITRGA